MKKEKGRSVAVVGLGYVGLPIAVAFGKCAPVIGFDINKTKVQELRKGIDRTGEVSAKDLSTSQVRSTYEPADLQSFENELQGIQAEQSEIFFEFSELNSDYATLDIEKILKECSAEAVHLISYQSEIMRLHERMLENSSRIISLLQDRLIHYANISDLENMIQKGLSHLEAAKAAYTARKEQKSQTASAGGRARVANDPKQKDKEFVLTCWNEWQRHPERYKRKANFARDMLSKCDHLTSQKKIEDWCREWEKTSPSQ